MTNEQAETIIKTIFDGFEKVANAIENAAISENRMYDILYALEAIKDQLININETMEHLE